MHDDHDFGRYICSACVGEIFLSRKISDTGTKRHCFYCAEMNICITVEDLADYIEAAFKEHYFRTSDQPSSWQQALQSDRESKYYWHREGQPVLEAIEEAAKIPSEAAEVVCIILESRHSDYDLDAMGEETEFSSESHYKLKGVCAQAWQEEWNDFERSLKTEARFFSRSASDLLGKVFAGIDKLPAAPRRPLVVVAGPNRKLTHLFRARVFQSDSKLEEALCRPDVHLGPPPATLSNAGRMNARGISVFYGATSASVALAEVRPPVGSKVVVAKFSIIRSLRLLDLTALSGAWDGGSIFDLSLKDRLERTAFLRSLGDRMTRPVMPDDEAFDYLATQAVADFLATEKELMIDGIIFKSVQSTAGRNIVIFHNSSRVEELYFPDGANISASIREVFYDEWAPKEVYEHINYEVIEVAPKKATQSPQYSEDDLLSFLDLDPHSNLPRKFDDDQRVASLKVDSATIEVHHVEWVKVNSKPFAVKRRRV